MFCTKCGKQILNENAKFCTNCGAPLPVRSSAPAESTPVKSTPVADTPKADTPKAYTPKADTPKADIPKADIPAQSAPVKTAPVSSTATASTPVRSTPVSSTPAQSAPVRSAPVSSTATQSATVSSTPRSRLPEQSSRAATGDRAVQPGPRPQGGQAIAGRGPNRTMVLFGLTGVMALSIVNMLDSALSYTGVWTNLLSSLDSDAESYSTISNIISQYYYEIAGIRSSYIFYLIAAVGHYFAYKRTRKAPEFVAAVMLVVSVFFNIIRDIGVIGGLMVGFVPVSIIVVSAIINLVPQVLNAVYNVMLILLCKRKTGLRILLGVSPVIYYGLTLGISTVGNTILNEFGSTVDNYFTYFASTIISVLFQLVRVLALAEEQKAQRRSSGMKSIVAGSATVVVVLALSTLLAQCILYYAAIHG